MGLREDIRAIVDDAFATALDNLTTSFTFVQIEFGPYDPGLGSAPREETEVTVTGVLVRYKSGEVADVNLLETGRRAIIPQSEFGTVVPDALDDQVTADGKRWKVTTIKEDPANAVFIFGLMALED